MSKKIKSPIFYMGNKFKLLDQLKPLFPKDIKNFYDLFGGSGVVVANVDSENKYYNEYNHNICNLFEMFKNTNPNELFNYGTQIVNKYQLETGKKRNMFNSEEEFLVDTNAKKERYNKLRSEYNTNLNRNYKDLWLLSFFSCNHLIRFNQKSEFNASFGSNGGWNDSVLEMITDFYNKIKNVITTCANYKDVSFINDNTFIYCDPPYLNTLAVYNEKRAFGNWSIDNDYELFEMLESANKVNIKWGLSNVFINRGIENTHLIEWCKKNGWYVHHLNRNYNPFSRGNSDNDEVYICNYINEGEINNG